MSFAPEMNYQGGMHHGMEEMVTRFRFETLYMLPKFGIEEEVIPKLSTLIVCNS